MKKTIKILILGVVIALGQPVLKSAANITNALTVHLKFDGNFNDSTTNGINGIPMGLGTVDTNNPALEPGFLGQAAHILVTPDGTTNRYVSMGYPPLLHFGSDATFDTSDFSVSMWLKVFHHTADEPFISNMNWDSSGNQGWIVSGEADGLRISLKDDVNTHKDMNGHAAAAVVDGNWHHLVITFERTNVASTYLDGLLDATHIVNIAPDPGNGAGSLDTDLLPVTRGPGWAVNLGEDGTGLYGISDNAGLDCLMDDVGIWRRALTADDVAQIYGAGLQGLDIEQSVNAGAFFKAQFPLPGSSTSSGVGTVSIQIQAGAHPLNQSSIKMTLDGQLVPATNSLAGGLTTVSYLYGSPQPLPSLSTHTVTVQATDTASPPVSITNTWSFSVGRYAIVPAAFAAPLGSANTPGMLYRSVWATTASPALAGLDVAESLLDGTLIDLVTGLPYSNGATPGSLSYLGVAGYYAVDAVNFEEHGTNAGDILGDTGFPGMPLAPAGGENDSFATETITFIELQPGYYHWGVYADDSFALQVGNPPQSVTKSIIVGQFPNPGRTTFDFQITQAGVYQFRLIYLQSTGAASEEWWSADPITGTEALINGTNANAIKAYRMLTSVPQAPYVRATAPAPGETLVPTTPLISADIVDGPLPLVPASVHLSLSGTPIPGISLGKTGNVTTVSYQVPTNAPLALGLTNTVSLAYSDGTTTKTDIWNFVVRPALTVGLVCHLPFDADYKDTSGNGVDGTPLALGTSVPAVGPTLQAGQIGQAVHLSATTDNAINAYVTLGYPAQLRMGSDLTHDTSDFSISFWEQIISSSADEPFISNFNWDSSNDSGWIISNEGSGMRVDLHDRGGSGKRDTGTFSVPLQDGSWHHVVVTFQRMGVANTYVDGGLVKALNIAPDPGFLVGSLDTYDLNPGRGPGTFAWNLGEDGTGEYAVSDGAAIDFLMDDLGIWRRVLTADEVANIYQLGLAGNTFAAPIVPAIKFGNVVVSGSNLQLTWSGGTPPYILQKKTSLTDPNWVGVQTNSSLNALVPKSGVSGFFRVVGQ